MKTLINVWFSQFWDQQNVDQRNDFIRQVIFICILFLVDDQLEYHLPRAAPRAMESLVGQSRVFLVDASPVKNLLSASDEEQKKSTE